MDWKIILVTFVLIAWASVIRAKVRIDYSYYCRPEMNCFGRQPHVMCYYPKSWAPNCVGQHFVAMTNARKQFLIDSHNERRNTIAMGQLGGVFRGRTAARMAEMVWDDELEMFAQKNLLLCQMKHDECRKTKQYMSAGQNLAYTCGRSIEQFLQRSIDMFWEEYVNITSIDGRNTYGSIRARNQYGHFTQMASDQAFAIGCGVISTRNGFCYHIACNYATHSTPIYDIGPVRSKCQTKSKKYPGLCGIYEDYFGTQSFYSSFRRDNSEVPPLKQWYANGHMLDVSNTPPYEESGEMVVTRQTMNQPTRPERINSSPARPTDRRNQYNPMPSANLRPSHSRPVEWRQEPHRPSTSSRPPPVRRNQQRPLTDEERFNQRINNWRATIPPAKPRGNQPNRPSNSRPTPEPTQIIQPNTGNTSNDAIFNRMLDEIRRRYP